MFSAERRMATVTSKRAITPTPITKSMRRRPLAVRVIFDAYTQQRSSINARSLNERQIPTRKAAGGWERSTVWGILRNPAYQGKACFGKTEVCPRQHITRPLRQRDRLPARSGANREKPRQDWIEIPVPALVSEDRFALAQEQLERNKHHSPRRTIEPTLLQCHRLTADRLVLLLPIRGHSSINGRGLLHSISPDALSWRPAIAYPVPTARKPVPASSLTNGLEPIFQLHRVAPTSRSLTHALPSAEGTPPTPDSPCRSATSPSHCHMNAGVRRASWIASP